MTHPDIKSVLDLVNDIDREEIKDRIETIVEQSYDEGYEEGMARGYDDGLESSGDYVGAWIEDGDFDWEVEKRAPKIGFVRTETINGVVETGDEMLQSFHRKHHKDSAYHWTFCGKCSKID